jgi:hypothetical protein
VSQQEVHLSEVPFALIKHKGTTLNQSGRRPVVCKNFTLSCKNVKNLGIQTRILCAGGCLRTCTSINKIGSRAQRKYYATIDTEMSKQRRE